MSGGSSAITKSKVVLEELVDTDHIDSIVTQAKDKPLDVLVVLQKHFIEFSMSDEDYVLLTLNALSRFLKSFVPSHSRSAAKFALLSILSKNSVTTSSWGISSSMLSTRA